MKQIKFLVCLFLAASAQLNVTYAQAFEGSDGIPRNLEFDDVAGRPIPIADHSNIVGTPFFKDNWAFGIIRLVNGSMFSDSTMNYSLYNDGLFLKRGSNLYPVNYPVKEFIMSYAVAGNTRTPYYFKSGFPAIENNNTSTFYQILFKGNTMMLLKREHKKVKEIFIYSGSFQREYVLQQEYFVYMPKDNKMIQLGIKLNLNMLRKNLPAFALQLERYNSAHGSRIKTDGELIDLFTYLDSENVQLSFIVPSGDKKESPSVAPDKESISLNNVGA